MDIIELKNNKGITLIELLIASAILGGLVLSIAHFAGLSKKHEKQAELLTAKNLSVLEFKKNISIESLDWKLFRPEGSFYFSNNKIKAVDWVSGVGEAPALSQIGFSTDFKHNVVKKNFLGFNKTIQNVPFIFYRDAHSLELLRVKAEDERRFAFSRCIRRGVNVTNLKELYNLPLKPFPSWEGSTIKVYCCQSHSPDCRANEIKNEKSTYQLKTVFYKNNNSTVLPEDSNLLVDGMGFFMMFNNPKYPTNYELMSFFYINKCKLKNENKKCSLPFDLETQIRKGSSQGVQDLGIIKIR